MMPKAPKVKKKGGGVRNVALLSICAKIAHYVTV